MTRGVLLVRADGTRAIGAGHVSRGIALAQWWQRAGGDAALLSAELDPVLADRASRAGVPVRRLPDGSPESLADAVADAAPAWVSLDDYRLRPEHQRAAASSGGRVLAIDDHGSVGTYDADLVLDQNLGADPVVYRHRATRAVVVLGPRYVLLREEFWDAAPRERGRRALLAIGGFGDDRMRALAAAIDDRVPTVVAAGDVDDMAAVMRSCAASLSAAGSTAWELAATGTAMVLVTVADNQVPLARHLAGAGAAIDLGPLDGLDPERAAAEVVALVDDAPRRDAMAAAASEIVDGRGGGRVVDAMHACEIELRPATSEDARRLWEWANDPTVRAASLSTEPIPWESHVAWLDARLHGDRSWILVAELDGEPVGQVRFDRVGSTLEVGLSLDARHRGRRLSAALIARGAAVVAPVANVDRVVAVARVDNSASARAFVAAGFELDGEERRAGVPLLRFVRHIHG